ncbi:NADAR family protein [Clostridium felsineum]|uniref:NADAR domain-containing protein n=1 Tax=Clostridium felsineum TaxID=36839 RepID=A0A1S8MEP1_9CLOT|nr:NADAR family protein [Clostridium felsineum]URZ07480.1 hypothetical protein CLROS_028180 [Clostridium felsineum]URZ12511.1 hypothetical protein CROST_032330 [Clostridium felsineum]
MNNEFNLASPMAPPWLMYPEIENGSIGWRMGYGEYYICLFYKWLESLTGDEKKKYEEMFPEPKEWTYFYKEEVEREEYYFYNKNYWIKFWQKNGRALYNRNNIKNNKNMEYLFFWGHRASKNGKITGSCLSQWWMSEFRIGINTYCCTEQFMMAEKARLFDDKEIEEKIIKSKEPQIIKALGRKVRNFDEITWNKVKYSIVLKGNYHKFLQNDKLREFLLSTKDKVLVEASPYDGIWGIKMSSSDKDIENTERWRGENLLGFALMEVRDELRKICENYDKVNWNLLRDKTIK